MALKRDLSDLAPATDENRIAPDQPAEIVRALVEAWMKSDEPNQFRSMADESARVRHSWAGMCAKRIEFYLNGAEPSDPPDAASMWRFAVGRLVHEMIQQSLPDALRALGWTEVDVETVVLSLPTSAGHIDLTGFSPQERRVAFEFKSINGYGYKNVIGAQGKEMGPRRSDFIQGAVNADVWGADDLIMLYASLESVSPNMMKRTNLDAYGRMAAQFTIPPEIWRPVAEAERGRWEKIIENVDAGIPVDRVIPDPEIPTDAMIVDPTTGRWEVQTPDGFITSSGTTWHCNYCPFQQLCPSTP